MLSDEEIKTLDAKQCVLACFRRAEVAIKYFERYTLSPNEQAVNQLRYAGHHLACALVAECDEVFNSHLVKAKNHCTRAYYDVLDGTIVFLLNVFDTFTERYSASSVRPYLADYDALCDKASAARKALQSIGFVKELTCDQIKDVFYPHVQNMADVVEKLRLAGDKVDAALDAASIEKEKEADRQYVISVLVSFFGLAISVGVIALYNCLLLPSLIVAGLLFFLLKAHSGKDLIRTIFWTTISFCAILFVLWVLFFVGGKEYLLWLGQKIP